MADMAVQCYVGNAARGMSLVALHNGGGVGIGKSINGGFGLVLDGSKRADEVVKSGLLWDVMGGVARRNWARNEHSMEHSDFSRTRPTKEKARSRSRISQMKIWLPECSESAFSLKNRGMHMERQISINISQLVTPEGRAAKHGSAM